MIYRIQIVVIFVYGIVYKVNLDHHVKILIVIETRIGNKIFSFSWRKLKDGTNLKYFCYKKIHIVILIIILNISWNFYLNNAGFDKKK